MSKPTRAKADPVSRFMAKVQKTSTCWVWTGALQWHGYGSFSVTHTRRATAHRWLYQRMRGPIPDGLLCCHTCDNRACVNPDHIFLGTHADNTADMMNKGRFKPYPRKPRTHCRRGHLFTPENETRRKDGQRQCRTCVRESQKRSYARRFCRGPQ